MLMTLMLHMYVRFSGLFLVPAHTVACNLRTGLLFWVNKDVKENF